MIVGGEDRLLTPAEVAALFGVAPKTVSRWAAAGRLGSVRTPGDHRRFKESEVRALLAAQAEARLARRRLPLADRGNDRRPFVAAVCLVEIGCCVDVR
jgi:excisionase family DNA binding protein